MLREGLVRNATPWLWQGGSGRAERSMASMAEGTIVLRVKDGVVDGRMACWAVRVKN